MLKNLLTTRPGKRYSMFIVLLLVTAFMIPITASAAYYNTYTTVKNLGNSNSCTIAEGSAVGSTYFYTVKINGDETKAVIYRTKMSDGTTTVMTNGDNGTNYATYLGHANDVVLDSIDGVTYMFIVTMNTGSLSLVKLKYVSTTYYKVGNYTIKLNGTNKLMSGVKITGEDANNTYFLFKNGLHYYRGSLPLGANSGTINVTDAFTLNSVDALVNGQKVSDIDTFATQGFGYHDNTIYVPLTKGNRSIVLVYHNISTASGTITSDPNLSFRVTSSAYPDLFRD